MKKKDTKSIIFFVVIVIWMLINAIARSNNDSYSFRTYSGYNGTKPGSAAESMEIQGSKVKCNNCGKHSDNGFNSTCDECRGKGIY